MPKLWIKDRIIRSVALRRGEVVLRADFEHMGSASQLSRALRQVVLAGKLVRLGYGVYARAEPSVLSGRAIPRQPLESLAAEALQRLNVQAVPGRAGRDYASGSTGQLPMRATFSTGRRRISRRLTVGKRSVHYENDY